MEHYKLVLTEHLNHYGYLFGGKMLQWVDELAYITANLEFPGHEFVTVGLDHVEFKQSIKLGSILRFTITMIQRGKTSVSYDVSVSCEDRETGSNEQVFHTDISFVSIDKQGRKTVITTAKY